VSARGLAAPWLAAPELTPELGQRWAQEWRSWFGPGRVPLPRAPGKAELALLETPLGRAVAKRERVGGWKRPLAVLGARAPRPERAFGHARALLARGLATPAPLAVLGRPGEMVLVTRYVEGCGPWEILSESGTPEALLAALAASLARLHAAGFRHRDLKASNLLLRRGAQGLEVVWTDLDGLRPVGTVEVRLRARDLARLGTSFESRAAREAGVRAGHWPELVRRYMQHALGRTPSAEEVGRVLEWTRRWSRRSIRRHLAEGKPVL
jgi:tRNA A-37 threonylcarbamoyl transferase component Bud32